MTCSFGSSLAYTKNLTYMNPVLRLIEEESEKGEESVYDDSYNMKYLNMFHLSVIASTDFILRHPEGLYGKKWSPDGIAMNLNVGINFIVNTGRSFLLKQKHTLCMDALSSNPNITAKFMKMYPVGIEGIVGNLGSKTCNNKHRPTSFGQACCKEWNNIKYEARMSTKEILHSIQLKCYNEVKWLVAFSSNVNLSLEILLAYPKGLYCNLGVHRGWNMYSITNNPGIPFEFILKHPLGFGSGEWNMLSLSSNERVSLDFVKEYSKKIYSLTNKFPEWDMFMLSTNKGIPIEYILEHPEGLTLSGVPEGLTLHTKVPGQLVTKVVPWAEDSLPFNPMYGATQSDILRYIYKYFLTPRGFLDMHLICINPGITSDFIYKHPRGLKIEGSTVYQKWHFNSYSQNPSIDYDFILKYYKSSENTEEAWGISSKEYPMIELKEGSIRHTGNLDMGFLSSNSFAKLKKEENEYIRITKEVSARIIWYKAWLPYYYSPERVGKGFDKDKEVFLEHLKEEP